MPQLPALSLAAVPGRRQPIIEIAKEAEARGVPGIYGPSLGDSLSLLTAIAMVTDRIELGTSITDLHPTHQRFRQHCRFFARDERR